MTGVRLGGRGAHRRVGWIAALLMVAACAPILKAGNAYEEAFAPLEGLQREGREMQAQPLGVVASGSGAWNAYELARRLELGIGVAKDPACAAVWYQRADRIEYDYEDWSNAYVRPLRYRRAGIPQARMGLRRLRAAGVAVEAGPAAEATERRCVAAQQALRSAAP